MGSLLLAVSVVSPNEGTPDKADIWVDSDSNTVARKQNIPHVICMGHDLQDASYTRPYFSNGPGSASLHQCHVLAGYTYSLRIARPYSIHDSPIAPLEEIAGDLT